MNKRICYSLAGKLCVVIPAPMERLVSRVSTGGNVYSSPLWIPLCKLIGCTSLPADLVVSVGETDDEFAARISAKDVPVGATGTRICDVTDIPTDRYFRNAWSDSGAQIRPTAADAKALHKQRLLERRDAVMAKIREKIDVADDAGNAALLANLKAKRAALRGIATKIDTDLAALNTLAAIKAYVPTEVSEQE